MKATIRKLALTALAAAGLAATAKAQAPDGQLRVATVPDGAMVTCDGVLRDATPITVKGLGAGDHLVVVQKPGFLEARRTISLSAGQKAALDLALAPVTGLALVDTTPAGAEVEVAGAHRGTAPLLITDLGLGRYRVKASATGYVTREVDMEIKDRIPVRVKIALVSDSAKLIVSSTPGGAAVTLNGINKGVTPCSIERIPSGTSKLVISLPDYRPFQQEIRLEAGEEQKVDAPLKELPGALSILTSPSGAKVYVDDQLRGQAPVVLDTVPAGSHAVRVEMGGYDTQTRTIDLAKSQTKAEEFQLVRNTGVLDIVTVPAGVDVALDGEKKGTTTTGGEKQPSAPLHLDPVTTGQHKILLAKQGFYSVEKVVQVDKGQTVPIRELMKRKFTPDTVVRVKGSPPESLAGCLSQRLANGDVELETKPGIFKTIKGDDVLSVEPIPADGK